MNAALAAQCGTTMNIGLIDVDSNHNRKKWGATVFPNLALAKLSAWHKKRGDNVEWYTPFSYYDVVYMAKVFTYTPDYGYVIDNADKVVNGGTGYDVNSALPDEVDRLQPDYTIYPDVPKDYAYGFLTRGCPNKCFWCVVPEKEGRVRPYMDVDEIATESRRKLVLMDNNILAAGGYAVGQFEKIIKRGYQVDFNQALDARLVTEDYAKLLARMRWLDHRRIRFGCDTTAQIKHCERAIEMLERHGFKGEIFLYTMIGGSNGLEECFERINYWRERLMQSRRDHTTQIYAYAQPYRDPTKTHHEIPMWQKDMAQWCNKRMIYTTTDFKDFEPRKGFRCGEYFK